MTVFLMQRQSRLRALTVGLTFAVVAWLISPLARAQVVDDKTLCAASVAAMDSEQPDRVRPFLIYILDTMETMDGNHIRRGEPGITAEMSDGGRLYMAGGVSVNCRNYPKMTVYNSVEFIYRSFRDLGTTFGTAK